MEELKFSLKLAEVPVKITGADGVEKSYVLKELDGVGKSTFLDDFTKRAARDNNGNITKNLKEVKGFQEGLITLCLFDESNKSVPVETIEKYPSGAIDSLFEAAQELSGLNKKAEEEIKND